MQSALPFAAHVPLALDLKSEVYGLLWITTPDFNIPKPDFRLRSVGEGHDSAWSCVKNAQAAAQEPGRV